MAEDLTNRPDINPWAYATTENNGIYLSDFVTRPVIERWRPLSEIVKVTPEMEVAIEEICKRVINEKLKELGLYNGD